MLALLNLILISISFYQYQYIIPIIPSKNKFEILTPTLKKKKNWIPWRIIFCIKYSRLFKYIIKKHEKVTDNLPIRIYFNKIIK